MASRPLTRCFATSHKRRTTMQKLPFELLKASMANQAMTNISTGKLVTKSRVPAVWVDNIFLCRARSKVIFESPLATPSRGLSTMPDETAEKPKLKRYKAEVRMDFYYDTISPYSWIAFEILQRYKPVWNLKINYQPVFIAGITKENNNKFLESLTGIPNKSTYVFHDVERSAAYYQVPLRIPESPFYLLGVSGSLKQQRFLTAVKIHYPHYIEACSRQFWYRCWSEDMDATKEDSFFMIGSRAGMQEEEIENCIQAMKQDDVKSLLKTTTSQAVEDGAFGLPFIIINQGKDHLGIENETYFGSDRFEVIANRLGLKWLGPVPDPEAFTPLPMAPEGTHPGSQKELFEELEHIGAIKTDFTIPDDTPTSQPTMPK